jgi:hypothetical protein
MEESEEEETSLVKKEGGKSHLSIGLEEAE